MDNRDGLTLLDYVVQKACHDNKEFMTINHNFEMIDHSFKKITKAVNNNGRTITLLAIDGLLLATALYITAKKVIRREAKVTKLEAKRNNVKVVKMQ